MIHQHFAVRVEAGTPVVLSEISSIGVREPGRDDWKGRLRHSATKHSGDVLEAIEDFIAKNETDSAFVGLKLPGVRLTIASKSVLGEIFSDRVDGWVAFRKRFACSELHSLSRVGFAKDGSSAVYFAYTQRDWVDGYGRFYIARKKDDVWNEDTSVNLGWIVQS